MVGTVVLLAIVEDPGSILRARQKQPALASGEVVCPNGSNSRCPSTTLDHRAASWFHSVLCCAVASGACDAVCAALDDKRKGAIVVVMQRLHVEDLTGHLIKRDAWRHIKLAAIAETPQEIPLGSRGVYRRNAGDVLAPEREPFEVLQETKNEIGSTNFSAQYQQEPVPPEGNIIRREWLKYYDHPPRKRQGDLIVKSWDIAWSEAGNYSVYTTWHHDRETKVSSLLDVFRERLLYPQLKAKILASRQFPGLDYTLIEDVSLGTALIAELKAAGMRPIGIKPEFSKEERLAVQSGKFEAGLVVFPKSAPWLPDLLDELIAFPHGAHDGPGRQHFTVPSMEAKTRIPGTRYTASALATEIDLANPAQSACVSPIVLFGGSRSSTSAADRCMSGEPSMQREVFRVLVQGDRTRLPSPS